jgi:hypothetical protein
VAGDSPYAWRAVACDARTRLAAVRLFHYHLVTSVVREVEARYLGKLAFELVARYGRVGDDTISYDAGLGWPELDAMDFKLRLSELERGAVNVVVQPGQWRLPRVDHFGLALDEDAFNEAIERAIAAELRVQSHGGRRTFVSTASGFRLELHPPRDWIDELLTHDNELRLAELELKTDDPTGKAAAVAQILGLEARDGTLDIGDAKVKFVPGGPQGRPELQGELFI